MAQLSASTIAAIAAAVDAALDARERKAVTSKPAQARAASPAPAVDRVSVCTCGATFKFGRDASEVAANALGLCGLKGRTTHRA